MNENNTYLFKYLGSAWDFLPKKNKEYFGIIWKSFEQIIANALQKNNEVDLNISLAKCLPYTKERWVKYTFNEKNKLDSFSEFCTIINIDDKLNFSKKRFFGIKINNEIFNIDCAGTNPFQTEYREVIYIINKSIGFNIVNIEKRKNDFYLIFSGKNQEIEFINTLDSCAYKLLKINSLPHKLDNYPFKYAINKNIFSIPTLQKLLIDKKDNMILKEGIDYNIYNGVLSSKKELTLDLWAKVSLIMDSTPYYNFGYLINYIEKGQNPEDYLLVLRGIWAAYWQGSAPSTIKSSLSLLLGLPVAKQYCLILSIKDNEITTINPNDGEVEKYKIPKGLLPTVKVGQYVNKFTPLTSGVEIYDKVNYPNFIKDKISRSSLKRFIKKEYENISDKEWEKIYDILATNTFLPQINLQAFSSSKLSLTEINQFLMKIKSLNTMYFPEQLLMGEFNEEVFLKDNNDININFTPTINLDNLNKFDSENIAMDRNIIYFTDKVEYNIKKGISK